MKINWKVRIKNPVFIVQVVMAVLLPILLYTGLTVQDLTSWLILGKALLGAILNPYVLGTVIVSVFNAINDPTTSGLKDSTQALTYEVPKREGE